MALEGWYGADAGGTFTDVVDAEGALAKVLSTPADPAAAVARGLDRLASGPVRALAHGTTVATNALLERRGARVALVTTAGLADVIEIGRQHRPSLYDIRADRPEPLVPRPWRLEVGGRLDGRGVEVEPLDLATLPGVPGEVEAVAVCLLHADLDPTHERAVAAELARRGHGDVSCSHEVSPEFREYERTITTVANAYLRPRCRDYLRALGELAPEVVVMTSAGGLVGAAEAAERPVALVLSGPAAGVVAGAAAARAAGFDDAVTFDMGGTSTDVCLVLGGRPAAAGLRLAAGLPLRLPALDIHTIGAGGGSVAGLDPGGALVVGPRSAGAEPGPACYGRGGVEPTVTDADLALGRIPAEATFGDLGRLDRAGAERALAGAGVSARGVCEVIDATMGRAVRAVTVERGVDPTGLALVAFGGAGGLHACAVAGALGLAAVVVPPRAGVLSAVGLLCAEPQRHLVRSWPCPDDRTGLAVARADLARRAAEALGGDGVRVATTLDCRYAGQSHELTVAEVADFDAVHEQRNGYRRQAPVEVLAVRATARRPAALDFGDLPVATRRRPARGPAVLAEADGTVWLPEGWSAEVGGGGSWVLRPRGRP